MLIGVTKMVGMDIYDAKPGRDEYCMITAIHKTKDRTEFTRSLGLRWVRVRLIRMGGMTWDRNGMGWNGTGNPWLAPEDSSTTQLHFPLRNACLPTCFTVHVSTTESRLPSRCTQ